MTDALTREQIDELRALLAKATPGPWRLHLVDDTTIISPAGEVATTCDSSQTEREDGYNIEYEQMEADAALIVAMRNAMPALLDLATRTIATSAECGPHEVTLTPGWLARDVAAAAARPQPKVASGGEDAELCNRLELYGRAEDIFPSEWRDLTAAASRLRTLSADVERLEALAYSRDPFDPTKRGASYKDCWKAALEIAREDAIASNKRERALSAELDSAVARADCDHAENARLTSHVVELEAALVDHNDLLRSAFAVAQRDAIAETVGQGNYRLLADRASEVLRKHHSVTNGSRAARRARTALEGRDNG